MTQKKLLALLLVLCMVLSLLPAVAMAETTVYYTLDGTVNGTNSGYATAGDVTQDSITWKVTGNSTMSPWRIGGKSITNVDRPIYSTTAMNETITKVEVEVGDANSITVNSFKLIVASDAGFSNVIEEQTATFSANSTISFTPSEGKEWSNAYYKFIFNVTVSVSSNKFVEFKAARFYKETSGDTPQPVTYTVSFDAGEGTGTMANETTTGSYKLPACTFTAPEGKKFDCWKISGSDTRYAAGESVTISADTTFVAQWKDLVTKSYTLVTSADELTAGDTVIVVGVNGDKAYALAQQRSNNRRAAEITLSGNQAIVDVDVIATEVVDEPLVYELTLGGNAEDGWTFFDPLNNGYLYAASSTGNNMGTRATNDDNNGVFALTFGEGGAIDAIAQGSNTHNYFRFNTGSNGIFSCYLEDSAVQNPIYLYKENQEVTPAAPSFTTHNLVLSGQIGVNFYMDLDDLTDAEKEASYMTFEISGRGSVSAERVPFNANQTNAAGTRYGFTCYVNAIQMADTITATFHYGEGLTVSETYSVKQYIELFEANMNLFDDKTVALIKSLADYGHYVQLFMSDAKDFTLGEGDDAYLPMDRYYAESYDHTAIASALESGHAVDRNNSDPNLNGVPSYALVLDSETAILVYVRPADGYTDTPTVTLDGAEYTPVLQGDGRYEIEIANISAHELGDTHNVTVTTDNSDANAYINVSVMSYVYGVLTASEYADNTNAKNGVASLYAYWQAATAYKNAN